MLEFVVIFVLIIATFAAVAWYGNKSRQQRTRLLDEIENIEPSMGNSDKFQSIFQQEVEQQVIDNERFEIDADPVVILSEQAASSNSNQMRAEAPPVAPLQQDELSLSAEIEEDTISIQTPVEPVAVTVEPISNTNTQEVTDWDMVIAFTVMARDDALFSGRSVKSTLESLDLHFGELQIYHRLIPGLSKQSLFSVANILDPGTLNPADFATMNTPGLLIFSRLPGPVNGLTLFEDLLDVAEKITDKLDGVLSDESRQPVNQATIESMRGRILNLNIQLQTEQSNYNHDYSN